MESQPQHDVLETCAGTIERDRLTEPGDTVLAAVSGGADSMAMLSILHRLSERLEITLAVGHFDHKLRESSGTDRRAVEVFSAAISVPFYTGDGDVHARAEVFGETIEEAARKLRYRYLRELAAEIGASRIATGHTLDDQAETVLMRILRGTGIRGLAGIPARRGRLIRPILGLSREETVTYCRTNHIAYVDDPSNRDRRFTRNWIRHELFPTLETHFPNIGDNIRRLARNAAEHLTRIRRQTTPLIERALTREPDGAWVLDLAEVEGLYADAKYVLFGDLLTQRLGADADYSRTHFDELARISGHAATSGQQLSIPGFAVRREFDKLVFRHHAASKTRDSTISGLEIPGRTIFAGTTIHASFVSPREFDGRSYRSVEPSLLESGGNRSGGVAYFALDAVDLPLSVRRPKPGDRMQPFGMRGHKKLSDLFVDSKVPHRYRERALVVSDASKILWVVGITTAESTRVSADTKKILKISVTSE